MRLWIVFLSLGLVFTSCSAIAGTLSIRTSVTVTAGAKALTSTVKITNLGDEAAVDVKAFYAVLGDRLVSPLITRIGPGQSKTLSYSSALRRLAPGFYPAVLMVEYHDMAGRAFSAVHAGCFRTAGNVEPGLEVKGLGAQLQGRSGKILFTIKNSTKRSANITAHLVLPKELECPESKRRFSLAPGKSTFLSFDLRNLSAPDGASYPVYLVAQYDAGNKHYAAAGPAAVTIGPGPGWFKRTRLLWIIVLILLLVALGTGIIVQRLKRPAAKKKGEVR